MKNKAIGLAVTLFGGGTALAGCIICSTPVMLGGSAVMLIGVIYMVSCGYTL